MSKRGRVLLRIGVGLAAFLVLIVVGALIVLQSTWFATFTRDKLVSSIEDATGGRVEVGRFDFDWSHLTVRIQNFVLHGKESASTAPLASVKLLEVRLHLFSSLAKPFTVRYLGVDTPQVNVIVFPNGSTNIPEPKIKSKPSSSDSNASLQTVINLSINQFRIDHGLMQFAQRKTDFGAQGQNLRLFLSYQADHPGYHGNLAIDPLVVRSAQRSPLNVHIDVPIVIEQETIRLNNVHLSTNSSRVVLDAAVHDLNNPRIQARLGASVSLPEMQQAFDLPIDTQNPNTPKLLTASAQVEMPGNDVVHVNSANVALGQTTIAASGTLDPNSNNKVDFRTNLALPELVLLLKQSGARVTGSLRADGSARLDRNKNYSLDGRLFSDAVSLKSGTTAIPALSLSSPFHADPFLISLDGLSFRALGGTLGAKIFVQQLQKLSVEANLQNFSLPALTAALAGHRLGYDGTLRGKLTAEGDLNASGTSGYRAFSALTISPGTRGVPLSGQIDASYNGARQSIDLAKSYIAMPHSRLDLSGAINRELKLRLVSRNLNDFLPAANFGSVKPQTSLPVTLAGGTAQIDAQVRGNLAAPNIQSHVAVTRFGIGGNQQQLFDRFGLDLSASPSQARVANGTLTRPGLFSEFDASLGLRKWSPQPGSPLVANVTVRNADLKELLTLAGESTIPATGTLNSDTHINGTFGNPLGSAQVQLTNASAYAQPIDHVTLLVNFADQLITLTTLELASAGGQLNATGSFRHPRNSFAIGHVDAHLRTQGIELKNFQALQQQSPGIAGAIRLAADLSGDLKSTGGTTGFDIANVNADMDASGLRVRNQDAGNLTATARTLGRNVNYNVDSNFAGSKVRINGQTTLASDYPTTAAADVQNLSVEKVLALAGQGSIPASGTVNMNARVAGTIKNPDASLQLALAKANIYGEPLNRFSTLLHYTSTRVDVPSLQMDVPAGTVSLSGSFTHPANSFDQGSLQFKVDSSDIAIEKIRHAVDVRPGLAGLVHLQADVAAALKPANGKPSMIFSRLDADAVAQQVHIGQQPVGNAALHAHTTNQKLDFRFDSDIAKSQIHGNGTSQLTGTYNTTAKLTFANIRYSNIAPLVEAESGPATPVDGLVEGVATVDGPVLDLDNLRARLQLDTVDIRSVPRSSPTGAPPIRSIAFRNEGPLVVSLNRSALNIDHFDIEGPRTSIKASGGLNLKSNRSPLSLNLDANADLKVLQDTNRDFYSSGTLSLKTVVRGTMASPLINGRVELNDASVNYAESPNGLSHARGVILLNGSNATIDNLTGESGGGHVTVSGFAGLTGRSVTFNLKAALNKVRVRTSGVSVTSDAEVTLTGNQRRSLANGLITIRKISYGASSDAGSFLSNFGTPPATPSAPNPLLSSMRLDIHIVTAPDLRVVTTYADRLAMEANLSVRGTAETPGIIGRVAVTDGQLVFFGNQYTVNTGIINFYNPTAIQPVLNVSLETIAQNVDVVLGVTGPIDNLRLSYRSDPPLTFQQIVQLLATNTTPNDPTIAARQPQPAAQSLTQMGSSALLGQAVANPLASRVQRVFGLSAFKIDPSVAGTNGQPTAKVTLQQKIASNITFTYITDVTQTNNQIIRIEWAFTPKLSAVGLRDYNGNVSIVGFYKFKLR